MAWVLLFLHFISPFSFFTALPPETGKPGPDCFNRIQWKHDSTSSALRKQVCAMEIFT